MTDPLRVAALALAGAKRRIFPCKGNKAPLTPHGFKEASCDPARIGAWWDAHPQALIGLPTGLVNKVFVLDIDNDAITGKDGDASLAALIRAHGPLPETVEALTPRGGRHLYFVHPGPTWEVPNSASKLGPHIDVRGDGGYVIVAPSVLPDGRFYAWEGSSDPTDGMRAAPAPDWLLALVARPKEQHGPVDGLSPRASNRIPAGRRNEELFRLGRSLRARDLSDTGVLAALRVENQLRCAPPLAEEELQKIAVSVCTVPPGPSTPRAVEVDIVRPDPWPAPGDLSAVVPPEPYPVDFLPPVARDAVVEYQQWGRQPMAMVAMSALGQMALACQGLADVARNERLVSPCSLNLLVMAESGERKTAADKVFGRAAREWQAREREQRLPEFRRASAMHKDWLARTDGVKKQITSLAAKDDESNEEKLARLRDRLIELEQNPILVRPLPLLNFEDVNSASLAWALATGWPSAGLFSDEGGTVIGGQGMGADNATSLLALLNLVWDGRDFVPTRKQAAVAELRGRRFSAFLMVQPDLLLKLIERGARNIGFIARFLLASPASTMGTRLYQDPPPGWQALPAFDSSITRLLEADLPIDTTGDDKGRLMRLTPPVMTLSRAAKRAFVDYHDAVERELGRFGAFDAVKDVGSKSAENACRIAAVCQIFAQGGPAPEVDETHMQAGIAIAAWHLGEAKRLFLEVDAPQNLTDARELGAWLAGKGQELANSNGEPIIDRAGELALRDIQRCGPNQVRDSLRRDAALEVLVEAGHVRLLSRGRQKRLVIHPDLLPKQ